MLEKFKLLPPMVNCQKTTKSSKSGKGSTSSSSSKSSKASGGAATSVNTSKKDSGAKTAAGKKLSGSSASSSAATAEEAGTGSEDSKIVTKKGSKKAKNLVKLETRTNPEFGQTINPISRLIQIQQAKKEKEPVFTLIAERGLPRKREFTMQVGNYLCNL